MDDSSLPLVRSNAPSTNELWDSFYKYEKMACDLSSRTDQRELYAGLAHSIAILLAGRMP